MRKIDIIYRCCEAEVNPPFKAIRPIWFDKINCLRTFIDSCDYCADYINSLTFLHDGPKGQIAEMIESEFRGNYERNFKIDIQYVDYRNNENSLMETFDIADKVIKDKIYFVEDDYLHLADSIKIISDSVDELGLVNGYDHLDRYIRNDDVTFNKESIIFSSKTNLHWRTAESTCCTWAATKEMWEVIKDDCRNFRLQDRELFRNLIKKGIRLWTPIPGITTQVDDKLSPGVDWKSF